MKVCTIDDCQRFRKHIMYCTMYTHGTHNFPKKIYFANARLISLIFERKCLLHICMNNIYMLLSTKHLFSKLNGLVDSCHGLKIWHIHFPKGYALVDHGTYISDLSIYLCMSTMYTYCYKGC